ncbi:MAG TPA: multidrug effflux MFS transporter [Roseiarcus sp.]|jgi:DHA1 family bicyclomycin/chloramphenicol resistance-like MFS transporter
MRIHPASFAFTLLLGFLAALPYSGIDINLPALSATGAALSASASDVGLTMSAFVFTLAALPLLYGPASDRFGRKPIVVFGILLFVVGSVACALAPSLPVLLASRIVQGVGAAAMGTILAIVRDLFDGNVARSKIANVMVAGNVATMVAPTAGAALLTLGNWRLIYAVQAGVGSILLLATLLGLSESARIDPALRSGSAIVSSYLRVLTHPVSFGFVLVGAAAGATVFAYVTGASLFFIGVVGLRPDQYGLIFSACSAAIMCGAFLDGRLGRREIASGDVLATGLMLMTIGSVVLLAMAMGGLRSPALFAGLLIVVAFAFGLCLPNVMNATMQPLPEIAGAVSAAAGSVQLTACAVSSGLVSLLFDGRSALSMTATMALSSLLGLGAYCLIARPAERRLRAV